MQLHFNGAVIHTHIYTYTRTYIHTYIHTYVRTYMHTLHTHTYIHTHVHTYIHYIHTHLYFRKINISHNCTEKDLEICATVLHIKSSILIILSLYRVLTEDFNQFFMMAQTSNCAALRDGEVASEGD